MKDLGLKAYVHALRYGMALRVGSLAWENVGGGVLFGPMGRDWSLRGSLLALAKRWCFQLEPVRVF